MQVIIKKAQQHSFAEFAAIHLEFEEIVVNLNQLQLIYLEKKSLQFLKAQKKKPENKATKLET